MTAIYSLLVSLLHIITKMSTYALECDTTSGQSANIRVMCSGGGVDGQSVDVLVIQRGGYVDIIQLVVVSVENYTSP